MAILRVKNLTKRFGDFTAVNSISFNLDRGEILGFLGVNGAGKTTTMQMLFGVLLPTAGSVSYFGKDLLANRSDIMESVNFSSTYTDLPWDLSVHENLTYISYLYRIGNRKERVNELIDDFKLSSFRHKRIHQLSAGQRTRVNLAKAFINSPKVLLLDEPTASLDPDIADYIREMLLLKRKKEKLSILWTSHNMAEVEQVCDRVLILSRGKIIDNDTPNNLAKKLLYARVEFRFLGHDSKFLALCGRKGLEVKKTAGAHFVYVLESEIPRLLSEMVERGIEYDEISIEKPTLQDYFLQIAKVSELPAETSGDRTR